MKQRAPILIFLRPRMTAGYVGSFILLTMVLACFATLPWSIAHYKGQAGDEVFGRLPPSLSQPLGTDELGRSLLWRCLLGGAISLGMGVSAAAIAVFVGVSWGAVAGFVGGRTDGLMMRVVDVLFGLPYILLVVLIGVGLSPVLHQVMRWLDEDWPIWLGDVLTLLIAIGSLSWLTMARVIRGQVLSLKQRLFIDAAKVCGQSTGGILIKHMLPHLVSPIVVYATLAVPTAILAESLLSFLGLGIQPPLPSWGNLASDGLVELHQLAIPGHGMAWWLIAWPCALLALTLLSLNFVGEAIRDRLDVQTVGRAEK